MKVLFVMIREFSLVINLLNFGVQLTDFLKLLTESLLTTIIIIIIITTIKKKRKSDGEGEGEGEGKRESKRRLNNNKMEKKIK